MTTPGRQLWEHITGGQEPSPDAVAAVVEPWRARLGAAGIARAHDDLGDRVLGLGPLGPLVQDDAVTDLVVNGAGGVWVDRGEGLVRCDVTLGDVEDVRRLAVRLAALAGQRLDDANPWVDGLLPRGIRLHALLPPLAEGGTHLSLRIPRRRTPDLARLREWGMVDEIGEGLLRSIVAARVAFLVTGGTGSGKTTVLGAMLSLVPPRERVVVVEDVRELRVEHPHVVRLQGRSANVEGRGEVQMSDLVRQSLRMRPDRLVVGEVRGAEIRDLLTALNTGHEGGCGTMHANTPADVIARAEALGALAEMSPTAVHSQLVSAVHVVVHLARHRQQRVLAGVGVLRRETERLVVAQAYRRDGQGWTRGPAWPDLVGLLESDQFEVDQC